MERWEAVDGGKEISKWGISNSLGSGGIKTPEEWGVAILNIEMNGSVGVSDEV